MIYYTLTISNVWLSLFYAVTTFFRFKYRVLRRDFEIQNTTKRRVVIRCKHWQLIQIRFFMRNLHGVNLSTERFSQQTTLLIVVYYYAALGILAVPLFLVLDINTHALLRMLSIAAVLFSFSISIAIFFLFSTVNQSGKSLVSHLNFMMARCRLTFQNRLKLEELKSQLESDQVGVKCANMFTFTTAKIASMIGAFVVNFTLIVKLSKD